MTKIELIRNRPMPMKRAASQMGCSGLVVLHFNFDQKHAILVIRLQRGLHQAAGQFDFPREAVVGNFQGESPLTFHDGSIPANSRDHQPAIRDRDLDILAANACQIALDQPSLRTAIHINGGTPIALRVGTR